MEGSDNTNQRKAGVPLTVVDLDTVPSTGEASVVVDVVWGLVRDRTSNCLPVARALVAVRAYVRYHVVSD
jgi:hypothetical protein